MNPDLLGYLCDPAGKSSLVLAETQYDEKGLIINGETCFLFWSVLSRSGWSPSV